MYKSACMYIYNVLMYMYMYNVRYMCFTCIGGDSCLDLLTSLLTTTTVVPWWSESLSRFHGLTALDGTEVT